MSDDALDVKVQPVPVDTLTTLEDSAVAKRRETIERGIEAYEESCKELEETLAQRQHILEVLRREHDNVILAQKLKLGDVVRVVCPTCKGSGFSPDDVTSGRVRGSAFEGRNLGSEPQLQDNRDACKECSGNRYVVLERFKG
jgi:DnaJ-class molecular chaperone